MVSSTSTAMFLHFSSFLQQKHSVYKYIYTYFQTTSTMFPVNIKALQFSFITILSITAHACLDTDLCLRLFLDCLNLLYAVCFTRTWNIPGHRIYQFIRTGLANCHWWFRNSLWSKEWCWSKKWSQGFWRVIRMCTSTKWLLEASHFPELQCYWHKSSVTALP